MLENTNIRIIGFADTMRKNGQGICGRLFQTEKGVYKADKILIASSYYGEIYDQLVNLGIDETIDMYQSAGIYKLNYREILMAKYDIVRYWQGRLPPLILQRKV